MTAAASILVIEDEFLVAMQMESKRCSDHIFHAMAREGMMRGHEHPSI